MYVQFSNITTKWQYWEFSHLKTLQPSNVHHVVGGFWNDAHDFERSLEILGVFAGTLRVLQDVLQCVRHHCVLLIGHTVCNNLYISLNIITSTALPLLNHSKSNIKTMLIFVTNKTNYKRE